MFTLIQRLEHGLLPVAVAAEGDQVGNVVGPAVRQTHLVVDLVPGVEGLLAPVALPPLGGGDVLLLRAAHAAPCSVVAGGEDALFGSARQERTD